MTRFRVLSACAVLLLGCGSDRDEADAAQDSAVGADAARDTGSFDPFGNDFILRGSWTINGQTPTASICSGVQAQHVFLGFYDASGQFHEFPELTFPCEDGSFRTGLIFAYGSYELQWRVQLDDTTSQFGPRMRIDVESPGNVATLPVLEFLL